MPVRPPSFRPPQWRQPIERERQYDQRRNEAQPYRDWYAQAIWRHPLRGLRAQQLARQPLCETCLAAKPSRLTVATVVHHKRPHQGDWSLFVDPNNHASVCKLCHDRDLQIAEAKARRG